MMVCEKFKKKIPQIVMIVILFIPYETEKKKAGLFNKHLLKNWLHFLGSGEGKQTLCKNLLPFGNILQRKHGPIKNPNSPFPKEGVSISMDH